MKRKHTILLGKTIKKAAALRGGGSALPGLIIEKLDKDFLADTLSQLPQGVILLSGTNGKTTTTKMVAELLENTGLKVFTNRTGSNFTRGVAAALLQAVDNEGNLPYDIAVLELDEAHATHFVRQVPPRHVLILNVMRDQLDRFGEIDHTARLLETVARSATKSVTLNRDDPRVARIANELDESVVVRFFGAHPRLRSLFVSDDELYAPKDQKVVPGGHGFKLDKDDVELSSFEENIVSFRIDGKEHSATLRLNGVYNFLNAAGALAIVKEVLGSSASTKDLIQALETVTPAFGRGETILVNGQPLELVLVKNPSGFRLALSSFNPDNTATMIAINDHYADGRDMSWLWDVDFTKLQDSGVQTVSGIRAYDMALRLQYDNVTIGGVNTDLKEALANFIQESNGKPKRIFCTYTAMLALRKDLSTVAKVEHIS